MKRLASTSTNQVVYTPHSTQQQNRCNPSQQSQTCNNFYLTDPVVYQKHTKSNNPKLISSVEQLKQIRLLLNQREVVEFLDESRSAEFGKSLSLGEIPLQRYLPTRFTITFVAISSLLSTTLPLVQTPHGLHLQNSKQLVDLSTMIE